MMTRRQAIKTTALVSTAAAVLPQVISQPTPAAASGPFTLPPLPYAYDALEPHIDARTMEIHHDRHHKAYVDNLNKAISGFPDLGKKPLENLLAELESLTKEIQTSLRNNGGGHFNHSLFWTTMAKGGGGEPKGELARAIDKEFGNFNAFKTEFTKAALSLFGSGWVWVQCGPGDRSRLFLRSNPNQDSPLTDNVEISKEAAKAKLNLKSLEVVPLLGLDVWEHAYYLKYQNKRADYIAAWWNVADWDFVADRYAKLKS